MNNPTFKRRHVDRPDEIEGRAVRFVPRPDFPGPAWRRDSRDQTDLYVEFLGNDARVRQDPAVRSDHPSCAIRENRGAIGKHHRLRVDGTAVPVHLDLHAKPLAGSFGDHIKPVITSGRRNRRIPALTSKDGSNEMLILSRGHESRTRRRPSGLTPCDRMLAGALGSFADDLQVCEGQR